MSNLYDQLPSEELRRGQRLSAVLVIIGMVDAAVFFSYLMVNGFLNVRAMRHYMRFLM